MTYWDKTVDNVTAGRLWRNQLACLVVYDLGNDYQTGDMLDFTDESGSKYLGVWTITHVTKNQTGISDGYAVVSLKPPDADHWRNEASRLQEACDRMARSNAALRGALTKLRRKLATR